MTLHVLTDKNLMHSGSNEFLAALLWSFNCCWIEFLDSISGGEVLNLTGFTRRDAKDGKPADHIYYDREADKVVHVSEFPPESRVLTIPFEFNKYQFTDSKEELLLKKRRSISDAERTGDKKFRQPVVLINKPISKQDLDQIRQIYPFSVICGYYHKKEEIAHLKSRGLEDLLFIGPRPEDETNALQYQYDIPFRLVNPKQIASGEKSRGLVPEALRHWVEKDRTLSVENVDALVAESLRQYLIGFKVDFSACGSCAVLKPYACVERYFLGKNNSLEANLRELYRYSPLGVVEDYRELPLLGYTGAFCHNNYSFDNTPGKLHQDLKEGKCITKALDVCVKRFNERYQKLLDSLVK
jgi:hypothetical protein